MLVIYNVDRLSKNSFHYHYLSLALANLVFCLLILFNDVVKLNKYSDDYLASKNALELNFSSSDIVYSIQNFKNLDKKKINVIFENLADSVSYFYCFISCYSILLMSLDRLFAVKFALKHKIISVKASKIANLTLLTIGIVISIIPVFVENYNLFYYKSGKTLTIPYGYHSLLFSLILFGFPLISSLLANIVCQYFYKERLQKTYRTGQIETTQQILKRKREKKLARTLKLLSLYYFFSALPFFLTIIISITIDWNKSNLEFVYIPKWEYFSVFNSFYPVSLFLLSLNGQLQLFIYTKNDNKIKSELLKVYDKARFWIINIKRVFLNCFVNSFRRVFNDIFLAFFLRLFRIVQRFFRTIFNFTDNGYRIEVIPPPRAPQNQGRANVYDEHQF